MSKKNSTIVKLPEGVGNFDDPKDTTITKDNKDLLAFIKKGGRSARPKQKVEKIPEKSICLRVPIDIAERVNKAVKGREVKTSANTWLVEAVISQLKREKF